MRQFRQVLVVAAVWCLGATFLRAEAPSNPLVGKWKHASGKITLIIEAHRLHILADQPGTDGLLSLHADYGLTRDLTAYGLFTRVEGDEGTSLLDEPFSFRARVEDGCLVIHEAKTGHAAGSCTFLQGVYRNAAAAVSKADPNAEEAPKSPPIQVPSCRLLGNRLENFALKDFDGRVWEYRRDRKGRLLLLDFWYHTCHHCLTDIPRLVALQNDFRDLGLEVVSIACETGPLDEQRQHVRAVRGRYNINYPTLLSGGGPGRCPVMQQLQVDYFPLLVLLDEDGKILWRSTRAGMDDSTHERLRKMIQDRLLGKAAR